MPEPEPAPAGPGRTRRATVVAALAVAVVAVLVVVGLVATGGDSGGTDTPSATGSASSGSAPSGSASPGMPGPDLPPALREFAVSPSGDDDDDGGPDAPWQTLGHALGQLRAGDRLVVDGGRYEENIDVDVHKGRQDAPVQVVPADGERPVVVGLLWIQDLSWWDIRGLNVTWDDDNSADQHMVKLTDGEGWRFGDAELWGARSFAALLVDGDPERFLLSGLYVHDTYESNDTNQDHLVYLNCGTGGGVIERSVLAHSSNGRALKIGGADSGDDAVADIVVRYVTMVDNRGPSNVQLAFATSDVTIEHSILSGSAQGRNSVTAFDLAGSDIVVRDNLTWDSAGVVDDDEGLTDGGRNVTLDPLLGDADSDRPYEPSAPEAVPYGRYAPG